MFNYIKALLKDDSRRYSLAKSMLFFGFVSVTVFLWDLTVTNQITPEYVSLYLILISGHHLGSKWLDKGKDN